MAPPRRVRDENLSLRPRDGSPERNLLSSREITYYGEFFPTQRRYQVSPDARALAYADPHRSTLHVLRRDGSTIALPGVENEEIRFSPDGKQLALVRWHERQKRVERIDLRTMASEPWAPIRNVLWMEYCAEGLILLHIDETDSSTRLLTLVPFEGEPRTITRGTFLLSRFVAAKAGTRVVYVAGNDVFSIDARSGEEPTLLGRTRILVTNAEMSPDGKKAVLLTGDETYVVEDDAMRVADFERAPHTIWFSRDGASFVWANQARVIWKSGDATRTFEAGEGDEIRAVRFLQRSPGLLVTRRRTVERWNPERDEHDILAEPQEGHEFLGADIFDGGLVLWSGAPWIYENPRFRAYF